MSLREFFNRFGDEAEISCINKAIYVEWSVKGCGFGQFRFFTDEDGKLHIDNEMCTKEFIKKVLGILVDGAILEDEQFMKPRDSNEPNERQDIDPIGENNT